MKLGHALILAINTSILAVLFAFTTWLYLSTRAEVEAQVVSTMDKAAAMTERLARLRQQELSSLAQSIAASPMLRGAAATKDADTIRDVLSSLAAKNRLSSTQLRKGTRIVYASKSSAANLYGEAELNGGEYRLVIGQAVDARFTNGVCDVPKRRLTLRFRKKGIPRHVTRPV